MLNIPQEKLTAIKKRIPERNASMAMVAPAGFEPATF